MGCSAASSEWFCVQVVIVKNAAVHVLINHDVVGCLAFWPVLSAAQLGDCKSQAAGRQILLIFADIKFKINSTHSSYLESTNRGAHTWELKFPSRGFLLSGLITFPVLILHRSLCDLGWCSLSALSPYCTTRMLGKAVTVVRLFTSDGASASVDSAHLNSLCLLRKGWSVSFSINGVSALSSCEEQVLWGGACVRVSSADNGDLTENIWGQR